MTDELDPDYRPRPADDVPYIDEDMHSNEHLKNVLARIGLVVMKAAQGRPELCAEICDIAKRRWGYQNIELKILTHMCREQSEAKPIEEAEHFAGALTQLLREEK